MVVFPGPWRGSGNRRSLLLSYGAILRRLASQSRVPRLDQATSDVNTRGVTCDSVARSDLISVCGLPP